MIEPIHQSIRRCALIMPTCCRCLHLPLAPRPSRFWSCIGDACLCLLTLLPTSPSQPHCNKGARPGAACDHFVPHASPRHRPKTPHPRPLHLLLRDHASKVAAPVPPDTPCLVLPHDSRPPSSIAEAEEGEGSSARGDTADDRSQKGEQQRGGRRHLAHHNPTRSSQPRRRDPSGVW